MRQIKESDVYIPKKSFSPITVLIIFLMILNLFFICYQLFLGDAAYFIPLYSIIRLIIYFLITFLCYLLLHFYKENIIDTLDIKLIQYAFIFLISGTIFYIFYEAISQFWTKDRAFANLLFIAGNFQFYLMHIYFIVRQRRAQNHPYTNTQKWIKRFPGYLAGSIIFSGILFGLYFVLKPFVGLFDLLNKFFIISCIVYSIIILWAVFTAYQTLLTSFFERANSLLIVIGYLSFLFCEIFVVAGILLPEKIMTVKVLNSAYYTPGFILLALSGYRQSKQNFIL
jgi:hypothetical protein